MARAVPLALALLLVGCGGPPVAPRVTEAWVRLPAVPGRPAAAYFTIRGGRNETAIVRVESALVGRIEMHQSMGAGDGMTGMRPLGRVTVPAGTTTGFAPGGRHLMLFDVDPVVKPGTALPLRFGFADGQTTEAEAKTVAAGEDAPY